MIEAVSAVVSNAQILRSVAEQTSTTQNLAANPTRIQVAALNAPYLNPHVEYTGNSVSPVFVVRDTSTGETLQQYPSEAQIKAYQKAAEARDQALAQFQARVQQSIASSSNAGTVSTGTGVDVGQAKVAVKQEVDVEIPAQKVAAKSSSGSSSSGTSHTSSSEGERPMVTKVDTRA